MSRPSEYLQGVIGTETYWKSTHINHLISSFEAELRQQFAEKTQVPKKTTEKAYSGKQVCTLRNLSSVNFAAERLGTISCPLREQGSCGLRKSYRLVSSKEVSSIPNLWIYSIVFTRYSNSLNAPMLMKERKTNEWPLKLRFYVISTPIGYIYLYLCF